MLCSSAGDPLHTWWKEGVFIVFIVLSVFIVIMDMVIIIVKEPSAHLVESGRRRSLHACHLAATEGDGQSCMGGLG